MLESSSKYDYSTLLVGAIMKPSIVDRDDYVKSKYKLRGIDSIKTDITKELAKRFTRKTKKKIDSLDPEVIFTINFRNESCHIRSKSISLQGRYNKIKRGFAQKQKPCINCSGKGCRICHYHGIVEFDSIEGKISQYLFSKFGGTTAKFTWIGGEDRSSLVLGSGRPFFVKIQNPHKRNPFLPKEIKFDFMSILNCKEIIGSPKKPQKFTSLIEILVAAQNKIISQKLRKLKEITKKPVVIYEKSGKRTEKVISHLRYKKTKKNRFVLTIMAEGGFPVKRFIESIDVYPEISKMLETKCSCVRFDFHDIIIK
jgi:tRNA pseudouridine synthase 10